jgi:hypothetical protein
VSGVAAAGHQNAERTKQRKKMLNHRQSWRDLLKYPGRF